MRGGGNDEIVSTGCGSPSVLHPWMLLLHMQETALWIHRLGPLSSRGGAQISWMLLLHMQETVFVDSPAGHLSSRGGGPDTLAPVLHRYSPRLFSLVRICRFAFLPAVNSVVYSLFTGFIHKFRPEFSQSTHYEHLISELAQNSIDNTLNPLEVR